MKPNNKTYKIKEFAQLFGVHPDTIRNYTKKGILKDKRNPINNYRIFTEADVEAMGKQQKN